MLSLFPELCTGTQTELKEYLEEDGLVEFRGFPESRGKHAEKVAKGIEIYSTIILIFSFCGKRSTPCKNELLVDVKQVLQGRLDPGRVNIWEWSKVEKSTVVMSGYVICFVYYGGANTF